MSNKSITIRFEPESNAEFVGEDCVEQYERHIRNEVRALYPDAEVELLDNSPMGTKVEVDGFGTITDDKFGYVFPDQQAESEVQDVVLDIIGRVGNNLTEICA